MMVDYVKRKTYLILGNNADTYFFSFLTYQRKCHCGCDANMTQFGKNGYTCTMNHWNDIEKLMILVVLPTV